MYINLKTRTMDKAKGQGSAQAFIAKIWDWSQALYVCCWRRLLLSWPVLSLILFYLYLSFKSPLFSFPVPSYSLECSLHNSQFHVLLYFCCSVVRVLDNIISWLPIAMSFLYCAGVSSRLLCSSLGSLHSALWAEHILIKRREGPAPPTLIPVLSRATSNLGELSFIEKQDITGSGPKPSHRI